MVWAALDVGLEPEPELEFFGADWAGLDPPEVVVLVALFLIDPWQDQERDRGRPRVQGKIHSGLTQTLGQF
jgi:hypothetical protein